MLEFVAIQRKDTGAWAIPGGMVDPGEKVFEGYTIYMALLDLIDFYLQCKCMLKGECDCEKRVHGGGS